MPDDPELPPDAGADLPRIPGQVRLLAASLQHEAGAQAGALCLAAAQLAGRHLRSDSADPLWPDRDRLIVDPAFACLAEAFSGLARTPGLCTTQSPAAGCGVGLALAERLLAARFGRSLVDHRIWVLCPGAALATGPVQEAAWLGGAWRLGRLTVLAACGGDQPPGVAGFVAAGWAVRRADAADPAAIAAALSAALRSLKPTLILCTGGLERLDAEGDAGGAWDAAGRRHAGVRRAWLKRLARHGSRQDFDIAVSGRLHGPWSARLSEPGPLLAPGQTAIATAAALMRVTSTLPAAMPELVMLPGSAGWTIPPAQSEPPASGRAAAGPLASGIGAVLFGVALHGGLLPIATHRIDALDALLPALRNAAAAGTRLVLILVESQHQASGLDAALHAIPDLQVFRPADASEALECLELAIRHTTGPSVLLASDAPRPLLADRPAKARSARGGYVAVPSPGLRAATLIGSGPDLDLLFQARLLLIRRGIRTAIVSLPCWDLFARQDAAWREDVLGEAPRIAIASGGGFGWDRWTGRGGLFLAPPDTAAALTDAVMRHLAYLVSV